MIGALGLPSPLTLSVAVLVSLQETILNEERLRVALNGRLEGRFAAISDRICCRWLRRTTCGNGRRVMYLLVFLQYLLKSVLSPQRSARVVCRAAEAFALVRLSHVPQLGRTLVGQGLQFAKDGRLRTRRRFDVPPEYVTWPWTQVLRVAPVCPVNRPSQAVERA